MDQLPASVQLALRRLRRRLLAGVFLDIWPAWASASLLIAGLGALVCRMWFPDLRFSLELLWLAPVIAAIPVVLVCKSRTYPPQQIAALADSLSGGQGTLLSLMETGDSLWSNSDVMRRYSEISMPRLRFWRRLRIVAAAAAFLAAALMLPQRVPPNAGSVLASDIT